MTKKDELPSKTRHLRIYDEDWEFLELHYGKTLGVSKAIRSIVHARVVAMRDKVAQKMDERRDQDERK